jgi:hypothetical protein
MLRALGPDDGQPKQRLGSRHLGAAALPGPPGFSQASANGGADELV